MYIPQHFDLELYTKSRQEANLDALLVKMSKIIEKHEDTDVLETAAKTLEKLCYESHVNYTKCQTARYFNFFFWEENTPLVSFSTAQQ